MRSPSMTTAWPLMYLPALESNICAALRTMTFFVAEGSVFICDQRGRLPINRRKAEQRKKVRIGGSIGNFSNSGFYRMSRMGGRHAVRQPHNIAGHCPFVHGLTK